ncbi:ShlB/FhaC/HecB family hemolysin secretion/activation protein [Telmatospirillum siberiense]|uniref:ShlB/FhaC/HecB family hemolysin secretion/activation protein n=1 Tax=Telmatospirillum siberiense TaxID=382514 RepID=A0A2N3PPX5_9PROT|nr:ShlB/FhaC/HecB family hemolysin secretion/activation protein [Telmatospirillum siberiense]PKU22447.1 ShlB/FhaC/HecB family hemolysin secretion/activation protein [Telmatospirillum siberiense]
MKINALPGAVLVLPGFLLAVPGVLAAPPQVPNYNAGDALHEAAPPKPPVEKPEAIPVIPEQEEPSFALPEGETIQISDFRLDGVGAGEEAEVRILLEPYRNKALSLAEIYDAAGKVTAFYRAKGFLVAKAYVPRQDATSGGLLLKVVIGKYGKISLDNVSDVADFLVQGTFESAMPAGEPVSKDDVERAMLLTSDLPGTDMPKITIGPGTQPGTTDFTVQAASTPRVTGYLLGDNYGSRYTGTDRLSGELDVNEVLGLGDKLSLSGRTAEAAGLQNGRVGYAFPLTYSGLRLETALSRTTYKLGDIYRDLNATGTVDTFEGTLSYPVLRSRAESLSVALNLATKRLEDKVLGAKLDVKKSNVGTLSAENRTSGMLFGFDSTTDASGSVSFGVLEFPNQDQKQLNQAGADTAGGFSKINLGLGGQMALSEELSLSAALKGQKALMGKNLDGSEQMSLSGVDGVRSYYEGVLGDSGYLFNAGMKYALPSVVDIRHAVGLFSDVGRVYLQNGTYTTQKNGVRLSDVGLGYYTTFEYSTGRSLIASIEGVTSVGPNEETGTKNPRAKVLARIGATF